MSWLSKLLGTGHKSPTHFDLPSNLSTLPVGSPGPPQTPMMAAPGASPLGTSQFGVSPLGMTPPSLNGYTTMSSPSTPTTPSTSGGWEQTLKSVGKGVVDYAPLLIGAYSAYENAKTAKQGQALQDEALATARANAAELAPLRAAGLTAIQAALQRPVTPLSAVGGYADMGNPYTHVPAGAPAPAPAAAPPTMPVQIGGVAPLRLSRIARRPA